MPVVKLPVYDVFVKKSATMKAIIRLNELFRCS